MAFNNRYSFSRILAVAAITAAIAGAQTYHFDNGSNATLNGQYFVREVVLSNVNAQGGIGTAVSVIGIATFDGAGGYKFTGQINDSTVKTGPKSTSGSGTYAAAANGFLKIASFAGNGAFAYGGVGAVGPSAFTASATDNSSPVFDLVVGIPISSAVSNASLKGAYHAVYLNFPQGAVGQARQAYLPFAADGAGGLGAIKATGSATDNASLTTQTLSAVTYSLSGTAGSINFGAAGSGQLIGGTRSFFVSTDGNLVVGGAPDGFDLLLASPAISSPSNQAFQGLYFVGGLEADNSVWTSQSQSLPDAFYGSLNSTGLGTYTSHLRLNANGYPVEDLTSGWQAKVQGDGSFTPFDGDQYWPAANEQVVLALGKGNFYAIMAGLHAVTYAPARSGDVFLNPLGIVNAASFAPPTNPVAPQEMVTLFGSNLATGSAQASTFPLPTTLLGTFVLVNGVPAHLVAVSPTQITLMVPSIATPDFTAYATFQVTNSGATCAAGSQCPGSKFVTMYTSYTAPGVFSLSSNGLGAAAAANAAGRAIGVNNAAQPGDIPMLFLTGMGSVSPALIDGMASSPTGQPLNSADIYTGSALSVYVDGYASPNIQYAGVVPGYAAGLYQINAQIPAGVSTGDDFLDILTPEAEAEQVTLNIKGTSGAVTPAARARDPRQTCGRGKRAVRGGPTRLTRWPAVSR